MTTDFETAAAYGGYRYTDIRPVSTIRELLEGSVKQYPDRPAFWVKRRKGGDYRPVSYSLLWNDVRALGSKLIADGLAGEKIAVIGVNSYEWIVTYLAAVMSGAVIVPLDRELRREEVLNVLESSGAAAVFYTEEQAPKVKAVVPGVRLFAMRFYMDRTDASISMADYLASPVYASVKRPVECDATWKELVDSGEKLLASGNTDFENTKTDPEKMAALIYTSGTTGTPKGVMLSQRNILSDIMDTCRVAYITPEDKTLSVLPIHHTYECTFGMLLVLYRGASTAFCEGLRYIAKNMNECHNTVFIAVPMMLELFHKKIWKEAEKSGSAKNLKRLLGLSRRLRTIGIDARRRLFRPVLRRFGGDLRMFIVGAAPVSPAVLRDFEDMGITVLQGYGLTECTPLAAATPELSKERYRKAGSVGVAISHGEIRIREADEDGIGKIYYKGPNVMLGYYNMPEETAAVLRDEWFETGDLGFFDPDGWLYIAGRYKNMIVTKTGKNIYPEEIEEVMNRLGSVSDCMVYAAIRGGEETVACQVYPDLEQIRDSIGHAPDSGEVYRAVKEEIQEANMSLASYKRIKDVLIRDHDFERTTTGKILRKQNVDEMESKWEQISRS